MISSLNQPPSHEALSSNTNRMKLKFKSNKMHRYGQQKQQPQFNDPLYQHLDNQVFNREQHNFGPWIELDRRSRQRTRQRQTQIKAISNLPEIYQQRAIGVMSSFETPVPHQLEHQESISLPIIRPNRTTSLQELRPVSISLNAPEAREQQFPRKQFSLGKQPFFMRAQGSFRLGGNMSDNLVRRSNVIYNYCLRQEEDKLVNAKLKGRVEKGYLKMDQVNNGSRKNTSPNLQLLKELKQHRINKFK